MLTVRIQNTTQDQTLRAESGQLVVGRAPESDGDVLIVDDRRVSRQQLRLVAEPDGAVHVENLGKDVREMDGGVLGRGETRRLLPPFRLAVGHTTISITAGSGDHDSIVVSTVPPPVTARSKLPTSSLASLGETPEPETLASWFETILAVQTSAATTDAFRERTARAVVELVGLDRGLVLERDGDEWRVLAHHSVHDDDRHSFSRTVLRQVVDEKRTLYEAPKGDAAQSLAVIGFVVASPIFDSEGEVVGALYGSRDLASGLKTGGISRLESQVVQLLAAAVSAGLARIEQEAEAARLRVQFEEFFSPALARELEANPRLLDAQEREITVLFSDVRGFSTLAERLGARRTYELVGDLLDRLTAQVLDHGGVVVDYYGDGLEAMWNAPTDQVDHRERAAKAALAMQAELPALNERWQEELGSPLRVGIGIHCGRALVGNAGSKRRLKYGPRGHVVNLAARIESATKALGVSVLVSDTVAEGLDEAFHLRRLGSARVAGVDEPVGLHELRGPEKSVEWDTLCGAYGRVLAAVEGEAADDTVTAALEELEREAPDDAATRLLVERAKTGVRGPSLALFDFSKK